MADEFAQVRCERCGPFNGTTYTLGCV